MKKCKRMLSILLCMMAVFSFAGNCTVSASATENTRTVSNCFINMPQEVLDVQISSLGGSGDYFSFVLPKSAATEMGIDTANITAPILTENSVYNGLYMNGTVKIEDAAWVYTVSENLTSNEKQSNWALEYGPTSFEFENLRISRIRTSRSGDVVVEATKVEIADAIVVAKKYDAAIDLAALTETTKIEKREIDMDEEIDMSKFLAYSDPYEVTNCQIFTGEGYSSTLSFDVNPFTDDTKFVSLQQDNMYIGAADSEKWNTLTFNDWTIWYNFMESGVHKNIAGPYQVVVPNFSGEYRVYGLKYGHKSSEKDARVDINGTHYQFKDVGGSALDGWGIYWSAATNANNSTITFTAGKPVVVMDTTVNSGSREQGGVLALAFVPVSSASNVTLDDSNRVISDLIVADNVKALSVVDFVNQNVESYDIIVKDSMGETPSEFAFTVKPLYRRSRMAGTEVYDYNQNSIVGHPTKYATVSDFIGQYLVEIKENEWTDIAADTVADTYQVYVNGVREYRPSQRYIMPNDVVEIKKETVTVHNFAPIHLSGALSAIHRTTNPERARIMIDASYVKPFLYNNETSADMAPFKDAKLAGYMTWIAKDEYEGDKVYFYSEAPSHVSVAGGWSNPSGAVLPEYVSKYGSNKAVPTIDVNGVAVHNPDKLYTNSTAAATTYSTDNLYWVNSTTTNDVRCEKVGDDVVIRTDGVALIRVITKKADGVVKTEQVVLTPGNVYIPNPNKGETIYVWEDTPYNGTTMKPLSAPFTAE